MVRPFRFAFFVFSTPEPEPTSIAEYHQGFDQLLTWFLNMFSEHVRPFCLREKHISWHLISMILLNSVAVSHQLNIPQEFTLEPKSHPIGEESYHFPSLHLWVQHVNFPG